MIKKFTIYKLKANGSDKELQFARAGQAKQIMEALELFGVEHELVKEQKEVEVNF